MKKTLWLALIMLLVCVFAFSACDSGDTPQKPNDTPSGTTDNTTESETDAHVHAFGEWTTVKDATCIVKGEQERSCSCGEKETQSIDATGHTEVIDAAIAATCTTDGKTEGKHCSVCSETLISQNNIPASHTDGEWVVDTNATCTEDGSKHQVCAVCSASIKTEKISATGHAEVIDAAVAATCTTDGKTEGKHCSRCTETLVAQTTIDKLGHVEVIDAAVAATCTADGKTEGKHCSTCGHIVLPQDTIKSNGHSFEKWLSCDSNYHHLECSNCMMTTNKSEHIKNEIGICWICDPSVMPTEGVVYDISHDGTYAEVIGYTGNAKNVIISSVYQGVPVTNIYDKAFYGLSITLVVIPNSVVSLGDSVFENCNQLANVILPNSITSISNYAFYNCRSLKNITIPDSITKIGSWAFSGTPLKSVVIPNNVAYIGTNAFNYCTSLTNIVIPNGITSIGDDVFDKCSKLEYNMYNECKYLGNENNPYVILVGTDNLNYSSYTIHEDTKILESSAFKGCKRISEITIPNSVVSISFFAFENCDLLKTIVLGDKIVNIGFAAFYGCSSLQTINYDGTKAQWELIKKGSWWDTNTGRYIVFCVDGSISK